MWMMTPRGFYSAVQKLNDPPHMLTVRARDKQDLENLKDLLPDAVPFQTKGYSDYPWRISVTVADWAKVCATLAIEIDYSNFKSEVLRRQGRKREGVYHRIWHVLLDLEPKKYTRRWANGDVFADDLLFDNEIDARDTLDEKARAARHRSAGTRTQPKRKTAKATAKRQSKPQKGGRR